MPHLSPMSWILAIITTWSIMMLFTSGMWWSNQHLFKAASHSHLGATMLQWQWNLQSGW
uniref:ATPase 8 n=1 Tax=Fletcherodrilus unicus TaxID=169896 RepID=Q94VR1_9ANNE|nr:ATPase 8 [Fletcherodrilus unicus]